MNNTTLLELENMLIDVKKHQRDVKELLPKYIEQRLDTSLQNYHKQLVNSVEALSTYDEQAVLKQLNKK